MLPEMAYQTPGVSGGVGGTVLLAAVSSMRARGSVHCWTALTQMSRSDWGLARSVGEDAWGSEPSRRRVTASDCANFWQ